MVASVSPLNVPGYQIQRELGAGGMARVYLAIQTSLDRQVALKVMSPALAADPNFSKRFLREARTIASLSHPNIVAIYEIGTTDQHLHFFSMQYLPAGDLAARMRAGMSEPELVQVLIGVCRALGFAHARGIVHRDVTPANIMFDQAGHPVLTDFGIALAAQAGSTRITSTGSSIGTSLYMSPEQARGGDVDARSDLYSLGALCYEALVGRPPYQGADGFAVAYAHVFEPIPRVPPALRHWQPLIDKALAKNPADRYASADEFIAALQALPVDGGRRVPLRLEPVDVVAPPASATRSSAPATTRTQLPVPVSAPASPAAPPNDASARARPMPTAARIRPWAYYGFGALAALGLAAVGYGWWTQGRAPRGPAAEPARLTAEPTVTPKPLPSPLPAPSPPPIPDPGSSEPTVIETPGEDPFSSDFYLPAPEEFVGPPTRTEQVSGLLAAARRAYTRGNLTATGASAVALYRQVLALEPKNAEALRGLEEVAGRLLELAAADHQVDKLAEAKTKIERALQVGALLPDPKPTQSKVRELLAAWVQPHLEEAERAEQAWQVGRARAALERALAIDPELETAKRALVRVAKIGQPGFRFRDALADGGQGPRMIVVDGGEVRLRGSRDAGPTVRIDGRFAVGQYEVTAGEYARFVRAARHPAPARGCNNREGLGVFVSRERTWQKPGFAQNEEHAVVCVSWDDAQAYVRWLAQQTGARYRLLSEPEWQFLAQRAASEPCADNVADARFKTEYSAREPYGCDDGHVATAPVGRFAATTAGVYDLGGNVREWVGDCGYESLAGRPAAPAAWTGGACRERLALGRSWNSSAEEREVVTRRTFPANALNNTVGFRVARELDPIE